MAEEKKEAKKSAKERDDGNYEKEVISKFPDLHLAQLRYLIGHPELDKGLKETKKKELYEAIVANDMAPFYALFCADLGIAPDQAVMNKMTADNAAKIKEIDAEIEDAEKNLGESEVRQALLKKFEYYCQIGDKDNAQKAYTATYDKTVGMGYRIDLVFSMIRVGLFFLDHCLIKRFIDKARELMEQGGDWERKNRLRSYEALYKMSVRDLVGAAQLYLEAVPTFGSYELMSYEDLVFYAVITAIYAFDRPDLREKVIRSNEIQEQLTGGGADGCLIPVREYLDAYYQCYYDKFFVQLAALESERLKFDRYLAPHYNFYSRAMRRKAYQQYLAPYKTVRTSAMAKEFGVSKEYIDHELFKFISSGQLFCRIDAVNGVIEMAHPDSKNTIYKQVIKDGDVLLNRIQKLSRVINA